mmetsp:Transcript_17519/g.50468  ORF Transcript_17519/g.50468 Transcript_17519/m.50468 type:complete len:296 (+) Transcript_17519:59-946(+)
MKFSSLSIALLVSSASAFSPSFKKSAAKSKYDAAVASLDDVTTSKPIFDPMGLYPDESPERQAGIIQPIEAPINSDDKAILDPLNLYNEQSSVTTDEPSASLPFLPRPQHLDGSMAGDRGFDPFNLASNPDNLLKLRNSELKHARLAMLASVGWVFGELFHSDLAGSWGLPNALNINDRVPSVLNGGLGNISPIFWISALAAAATVEAFSGAAGEIQSADLGFDPLGLSKKSEGLKRYLEESELFNGRLAMLAITGFAIQEWFTGNSVVDATPIFFKPFNVVMEQLLASGGATSL